MTSKQKEILAQYEAEFLEYKKDSTIQTRYYDNGEQYDSEFVEWLLGKLILEDEKPTTKNFKIGETYCISGKNVIAREDTGEDCGNKTCVFFKDCIDECNSREDRNNIYFEEV